jgi:hypothetical protein
MKVGIAEKPQVIPGIEEGDDKATNAKEGPIFAAG